MRLLAFSLRMSVPIVFVAIHLAAGGERQSGPDSPDIHVALRDFWQRSDLDLSQQGELYHGPILQELFEEKEAISFPQNPWRGTIWEDYCHEKCGLFCSHGVCMPNPGSLSRLSHIYRSFLGLICSPFAPAEDSIPREPQALDAVGRFEESGHSASSFDPPGLPEGDDFSSSSHLAPPVDSFDPGYGEPADSDLNKEVDRIFEAEVPDSTSEKPLRQPVIEPEARPTRSPGTLPRNMLPPSKKTGPDNQQSVTVPFPPPAPSPSEEQAVPPLQKLPKNHLPKNILSPEEPASESAEDSSDESVTQLRFVPEAGPRAIVAPLAYSGKVVAVTQQPLAAALSEDSAAISVIRVRSVGK